MSPLLPLVLASAWVVLACSPAFDWREVRHADAGIVAVFPCRPQHHVRSVTIEQTAVPLHLMACSAAGRTFGISYIDVGAAEAVGPALSALQTAAVSHIKAARVKSTPLKVTGATPLSNSTLVSVDGTTANGDQIHLHVGMFASGLRAYQATTFAPAPDLDAIQTFFSGIQVR